MLNRLIRNPSFLIIVAVILIFYGLRFFLPIPTLEELLIKTQTFYEQYGTIVVLIGAFVEGLFVLNWYFPGSTIALLGAVFAKDIPQLAQVIILGTFGFWTAGVIDYLLGKYGLYKLFGKIGFQKGLQEAEKRLEKSRDKALVLGLLLPPTATIFSTAAGILHFPIRKFFALTLLTLLARDALWGILAYNLGTTMVQLINNPIVAVILLVVLFAIISKSERKTNENNRR